MSHIIFLGKFKGLKVCVNLSRHRLTQVYKLFSPNHKMKFLKIK